MAVWQAVGRYGRFAGQAALAARHRDRRLVDTLRAAASRSCPWDAKIDARRVELLARPDATGPGHKNPTIGAHAASTAMEPRWGHFLHELIRRTEPKTIVEMGSSVGLSGSYMTSALHDLGKGRLISLEGDPVIAETARDTLRGLGLDDRAEVRTGYFVDTLDQALRDAEPIDLIFVDGHHEEEPTLRYFEQIIPFLADDAIVLFDDIHLTDEMERAWRRVMDDERTLFALDLERLGVWVERRQG